MVCRCLKCPSLSLLSAHLRWWYSGPTWMILDNLPNLDILHFIRFAKAIFPCKVPFTVSRESDLISVAVITHPATLPILANEGTCYFFTNYNFNLTSSPPQSNRSLRSAHTFNHRVASTTREHPVQRKVLLSSNLLKESPAPGIFPSQCLPGGVSCFPRRWGLPSQGAKTPSFVQLKIHSQ